MNVYCFRWIKIWVPDERLLLLLGIVHQEEWLCCRLNYQ